MLKKVPIDVQSLLCATVQINNYRKVIEELVYNALDADSTSIAIRVHTLENSLQVIDNGHGIAKCDFCVLGQRYMTSKYVDLTTLKSAPNKYGKRGESVANIIEVSQSVKVISRHEHSEETWMKIFHNAKQHKILESTTRSSKGTTVEIKGFLHNFKIKKNALDPLNEMQNIKAFLEQLSLVHNNISLSLRDDSKNEIIFKLHKKRDIYQTLSTLFNIEKADVQELKVEKNQYKVTAFIGKTDKDVGKHWIFVNRKFVNDNSKLHKLVNNNMSKNMKGQKQILKSKPKNNNYDENNILNKKTPFYFILIACSCLDYDVSNTQYQNLIEIKNWEQVTKLLEKLIKFYFGDINLKEIAKPEIRQKEIEAQTHDTTRDQVKKIIDKFLGNKLKKIGISQMQNGVKGKRIKRKIKKPLNISVLNIIPPKDVRKFTKPEDNCVIITKGAAKIDHDIINFDNLRSKQVVEKKNKAGDCDATKKFQHNKKETNNVLQNYQGMNPKHKLNKQSKRHKIISTRKPHLKLRNTSKQGKETKKSTFIKDPMISRFADPTDSVQKRCQIIAQKADEALNSRIERKREIIINERVQYSSAVQENKNLLIRKKVDELIIHDSKYTIGKVNKNNIGIDVWNKLKPKAFKSTYDLVQTILKTQQENNMREGIKKNNEIITESDIHVETNHISSKIAKMIPFAHRLTFESHDYDKYEMYNPNNIHGRINAKNHKTFQFMTKQSRENFIAPNNRYCPTFLSKTRLKSGHHKYYTTKNKNTNDKQNLEESSYTIDFSQSDINYSVYNKHQKPLKTFNYIYQPYNISNYRGISKIETSQNKNKVLNISDIGLNTIMENTYTISKTIDVIRNNPFATYSVHHSNDKYSDKQICNISLEGDNISQEQNSDVVFISKSQDPTPEESIDKQIEPINHCETVLNSYNIFENEFEVSFNYDNRQNVSMIKFNMIADIDNTKANNCQQVLDIELPNNVSHHFSTIRNNSNTYFDSEHKDLRMQNPLPLNQKQISDHMQGNLNEEQLPGMEANQHVTNTTDLNSFDLKNRHRFVPKGMSPIFENCYSKVACNYSLDKEYYEDSLYNKFVNDVQINSEVFEPRIESVKDITTIDINIVNSRLSKDNASLKFDGQSLNTAKVLGQIDRKFIAAILNGKSNQLDEVSEYLILFDQHAVHERIRLEENLSDYLNNGEWNSVTLDDITMRISKDVVLYLHNFKEKFTQFGLRWTILSNGDITITAIPEAILGKNPRQVDKIIKAVKNLIAEEINNIKLQRGCVSLYPKSIMELVFSEACRYAIKFGDKLTKNDCVKLINMLSECKTPFQCAHGRPVMAVLMDIKSNKRVYKVNLTKIKKVWNAGK